VLEGSVDEGIVRDFKQVTANRSSRTRTPKGTGKEDLRSGPSCRAEVADVVE
jgi:hypothetical protein